MLPFIAVPIAVPETGLQAQAQVQTIQAPPSPTIPNVPFYSQFKDIQSPKWQNVGCGITSLAMVINFYKPAATLVDTLLKQGIAAGAYKKGVGWTYKGLIKLSQKYGLNGDYYDLSKLDAKTAFAKFQNFLRDGPVILSVRNRFNPKSTVPHLVVINGIYNDAVYYNDPAAKTGMKKITTAEFLKSWKKKVIVLRPPTGVSGEQLTLR